MNKKGFTIIEVLVVVVIIGIISTIAIVSVSNQRTNASKKQLRALTSTIESAFQIYRLENEVFENEIVSSDKLKFNKEISYNNVVCTDLSSSYIKYVIEDTIDNNNSKEEIYCVYLYCDGNAIINDFVSNELYCKK